MKNKILRSISVCILTTPIVVVGNELACSHENKKGIDVCSGKYIERMHESGAESKRTFKFIMIDNVVQDESICKDIEEEQNLWGCKTAVKITLEKKCIRINETGKKDIFHWYCGRGIVEPK